MKRKVLVLVLVCGLMFAGTALAHPFVIRSDAVRPTDAQIDSFLQSHRDNEWVVYGIQYYDKAEWEWRFVVVAWPQYVYDIDTPMRISNYDDRIEISVGPVGINDNWEFDILWSSGNVETRGRYVQFRHRPDKGDYGVVRWDPTSPLQLAMEGAMETMTSPFRQIVPTVLTMTVGLVGFAKGLIWLRRQLSGA